MDEKTPNPDKAGKLPKRPRSYARFSPKYTLSQGSLYSSMTNHPKPAVTAIAMRCEMPELDRILPNHNDVTLRNLRVF